MRIKQYQVDAFANRAFEGNPAAVCPLEHWLDDAQLQAIAEENNLSETAFFVSSDNGFKLRWFTPVEEVDLCGHATLAAAHVLFQILGYSGSSLRFDTRSGPLFVNKQGDLLQIDLPASPPTHCEAPAALIKGLGVQPIEVLAASDYLVVFDSETTIRAIQPDPHQLSQLDLQGIIITAPGDEVDFVSRFFAPQLGIPEDPVTGSAHCVLTPYWADKLNKNLLSAKQVSKRGGSLTCELQADRVLLSGSAVIFMEAEINF